MKGGYFLDILLGLSPTSYRRSLPLERRAPIWFKTRQSCICAAWNLGTSSGSSLISTASGVVLIHPRQRVMASRTGIKSRGLGRKLAKSSISFFRLFQTNDWARSHKFLPSILISLNFSSFTSERSIRSGHPSNSSWARVSWSFNCFCCSWSLWRLLLIRSVPSFLYLKGSLPRSRSHLFNLFFSSLISFCNSLCLG